jgi:hypothetical protein
MSASDHVISAKLPDDVPSFEMRSLDRRQMIWVDSYRLNLNTNTLVLEGNVVGDPKQRNYASIDICRGRRALIDHHLHPRLIDAIMSHKRLDERLASS